ncbi:MAG: aminotransferase class IV [Candidatus Methylacidiphilales bacterium]
MRNTTPHKSSPATAAREGSKRSGRAVSLSSPAMVATGEKSARAVSATATVPATPVLTALTFGSSFRPWLGVFETIRVEQGVPLFVNEHWKSIRYSADVLGLEVMRDFRAAAERLPELSGRWRWIVTPGESVQFFTEDQGRVPTAYSLALAEQQVCSKNWDARHKTLSYLTHYQARATVRADEAVLLNEHGVLATCAMGNLFWVVNDQLCTPPTDAGCRRGVVRDFVMRHARVKEVCATPDVLDEASEIFVTNSWIGVRPVWRWREKTLPLGEKCRALRQAYRNELYNQLQRVKPLMDGEIDN